MLANLSIKSRLIFVIGFLSTLLVGVGIMSLASLSATNSNKGDATLYGVKKCI